MNRRATSAALTVAWLAVGGCGARRAVGPKGSEEGAAPEGVERPPAVATSQGTSEEGVAAAVAEVATFLALPDLPYNVREGRALFRHYCATCHGEEGGGDGFNAYNLDPKPRDLADPAFQAERSDADLVAIIRIGGGAAGLSTGMPPWGRTLGERQMRNLVAYVRALAPPSGENGS